MFSLQNISSSLHHSHREDYSYLYVSHYSESTRVFFPNLTNVRVNTIEVQGTPRLHYIIFCEYLSTVRQYHLQIVLLCQDKAFTVSSFVPFFLHLSFFPIRREDAVFNEECQFYVLLAHQNRSWQVPEVASRSVSVPPSAHILADLSPVYPIARRHRSEAHNCLQWYPGRLTG